MRDLFHTLTVFIILFAATAVLTVPLSLLVESTTKAYAPH